MQGNTIREQMSALRIRSAGSATQLESAVSRMKDWREHVRAHPWLAGGAAMLAAYALVPNRIGRTAGPTVGSAEEVPTSMLGAAAGAAVPVSSWMPGLTRMAANFAIGLAVKAVRDRMTSRSCGDPRPEEGASEAQSLPFDHPDRNRPDWTA